MTIVEQQIDAPTKGTVDHIQEQILKRICFAFYRPAYQLKETALANDFDVSRTPVRDAIQRIGHLGLVETRNGVGTIVTEPSNERIRHLYEMRMELAELIGELSPAAIETHHQEEICSIRQSAPTLRESMDSQEYVKLNQRLQALITSLIGNMSLRDFWNQAYFQATSVWHRMEQLIGSEAYDALVREAFDLLMAVERKDIAAVGYLQRTHIGYGFQSIEELLLTHPK
ncbi:GntR family transcriptional regulator [Ruegeria sp. 6PALISEP08]|uniref:GntR family transcriptional regulator n=1 Tax=Ruegeria sp. 6PALISEP08 TaxID=1225660 RepID=UPI00067EB8D5|nr:GntR family transcriptional regulator [Ruegeria sp. 6PALISEP08]